MLSTTLVDCVTTTIKSTVYLQDSCIISNKKQIDIDKNLWGLYTKISDYKFAEVIMTERVDGYPHALIRVRRRKQRIHKKVYKYTNI